MSAGCCAGVIDLINTNVQFHYLSDIIVSGREYSKGTKACTLALRTVIDLATVGLGPVAFAADVVTAVAGGALGCCSETACGIAFHAGTCAVLQLTHTVAAPFFVAKDIFELCRLACCTRQTRALEAADDCCRYACMPCELGSCLVACLGIHPETRGLAPTYRSVTDRLMDCLAPTEMAPQELV